MATKIYLLGVACLASQCIISNLVQYYDTASYVRTCLLENNVWQIHLGTHGYVLLLAVPLIKFLVRAASWNDGYHTATLIKMFESLVEVCDSRCTCCSKRWVHNNHVMLVSYIVILKGVVEELSA